MQTKDAVQLSRRSFLKRITFGLAGASATAVVVGATTGIASPAQTDTGLPSSGSIFEPRKQDLRNHWYQKLSRFRLR